MGRGGVASKWPKNLVKEQVKGGDNTSSGGGQRTNEFCEFGVGGLFDTECTGTLTLGVKNNVTAGGQRGRTRQ